jgi:hypothetical protein
LKRLVISRAISGPLKRQLVVGFLSESILISRTRRCWSGQKTRQHLHDEDCSWPVNGLWGTQHGSCRQVPWCCMACIMESRWKYTHRELWRRESHARRTFERHVGVR